MAGLAELAKMLDLGVLSADAVVAITNRLDRDKNGKQITDQDKIAAIKKYNKDRQKGRGGKGNYAKGGYTKKYAYGGGVRKAKMNKYG
tara:strand:+ start:630 stop:893 length:264 start_codon:yes stop_codon:yes gene_type:complete